MLANCIQRLAGQRMVNSSQPERLDRVDLRRVGRSDD
jgi:hypothetical protein